MAITRAQQARQMYKRGTFGGSNKGPQGPAGGASAGGNYGGNRNPSQDYGGRDVSDDFGQFERRRQQNQALEGAGFLGKDLGMNIGEQSSLAKFGDVIGGLPLIRLLRSLPQGTRPVTTPVGGGGDSQAMATIPTWMQLGFSSEAEYLASLEDEEDKDKEAEEGLRLAFRADGGRIGLQEGGGIEQRLEQLGGDVTSAEQMLQGINERLKTAESSLGSGGAMQQPVGSGLTQPAGLGIFAGRPIQLPGIRPDFSATIDPNFKPVEELKAVQPGDPGLIPLGRPTTSGFETSFGFMDFDPNRERQYFYNKDLNRLFNLGMGTKMAAPKGFESVSKEQYEDFASKGATLQKASPFVDAMGGGYNLDIPRDKFGTVDRTSSDYLYFFGDQQKKSMLPAFGTGPGINGGETITSS
jgi:hypothetical protein